MKQSFLVLAVVISFFSSCKNDDDIEFGNNENDFFSLGDLGRRSSFDKKLQFKDPVRSFRIIKTSNALFECNEQKLDIDSTFIVDDCNASLFFQTENNVYDFELELSYFNGTTERWDFFN